MDLVALLLVGLAVGIASYGVLDTLFSEDRRVRRRLSQLDAFTAQSVGEAEPLATPFRSRVLRHGVESAGEMVGRITPHGYLSSLDSQIVKSGAAGRASAEGIVLFKVLGAIAGALVGTVIVRGGLHGSLAQTIVAALGIGLVASITPDLTLHARASKRQQKILRELPDMLDMLTISVEAGLGFDQAVARYVTHSQGPLGKEFGIALSEIQAGKSRREALQSLADRVDVQELRTFVLAVVQADVFGVSVSDVLRTQSREMRIKRRQRAEEMAQKAPAKMAFPLVICILPATLIVVMAPAIVGLMRLFAG